LSVYLDASVLVPIFVDDDWSERVVAWLETEPDVVVSDWTLAEFSSALSFHVRKGKLDPDERDEAENSLNRWIEGSVTQVPVDPEDVWAARDLLHAHPKLRAPDALHLAIVKRLGEAFATYDTVLADAARREAVDVLAP
jgi:hypothetical protein